MAVDRTELADILAEATGWSVSADPHRLTFTHDDPPQVVIWTVTDTELGQLQYNENLRAKKFGGSQTAELGVLAFPIFGALGPFEGSRGYMNGADLTVRE